MVISLKKMFRALHQLVTVELEKIFFPRKAFPWKTIQPVPDTNVPIADKNNSDPSCLFHREAFHYVQQRRFCINPNEGFVQQLMVGTFL